MMEHFRKMRNEQYEEMFNLGLACLRQRAEQLQNQLRKFMKNRDEFKEALTKIKESMTKTNE
jgi:hypothetical protein